MNIRKQGNDWQLSTEAYQGDYAGRAFVAVADYQQLPARQVFTPGSVVRASSAGFSSLSTTHCCGRLTASLRSKLQNLASELLLYMAMISSWFPALSVLPQSVTEHGTYQGTDQTDPGRM